VPFTDFADQRTGLSGLSSELLIEGLIKSGRFRMIDPSTLDEVIHRQELSLSGLASPATEIRAGGILQPDVLLFGRIGIVDGEGRLLLTFVDPETGEVFWKDSFPFRVTPGIKNLASHSLGDSPSDSQESAWSLIKGFVVSNWPWLWTVILVPAAAWPIRRSFSKPPTKKGSAED
jgi:hypothetical protein